MGWLESDVVMVQNHPLRHWNWAEYHCLKKSWLLGEPPPVWYSEKGHAMQGDQAMGYCIHGKPGFAPALLWIEAGVSICFYHGISSFSRPTGLTIPCQALLSVTLFSVLCL